jgi:hypothetical protein
MAFSPFRKLRLERLETRDVPSSLGATPSAPPPSTLSGLTYVDPTMMPSDPGSTNVAVLIVSQSSSDSVNVTGLTAANLKAGASLQLVVGASTFSVSAFALNQDGSYHLTVSNPAGLTDAVTQNVMATVIIGNGGNVTPTVPTPPPPSLSLQYIDPTLNPQG